MNTYIIKNSFGTAIAEVQETGPINALARYATSLGQGVCYSILKNIGYSASIKSLDEERFVEGGAS